MLKFRINKGFFHSKKDKNSSNEETNSQEKFCVSGTNFTATWDDATQTCTCKGILAAIVYEFVENTGCVRGALGGGEVAAPEIGGGDVTLQ